MQQIQFLALVLILQSLPTSSLASIFVSGSGGSPVIAVTQPRKVALGLIVPADFVSVPLRILSDQKNAAAAYEESREAIGLIQKRANEKTSLRILTGPANLSERQSSFGISSGSWKSPAAVTEMQILVILSQEKGDIYSAAAEAARFVDSLRLPPKMSAEIGQIHLAVNDPEQFRTRLLEQITAEIQKTRSALSAQGAVQIDGLEHPVMVRQVDDRQVEVSLSYTLSFTANSTK